MLETIEGVYRDGKIELLRTPRDVSDNTPVIVTFLTSNSINLRERGIDQAQAAVLRTRFATFAEDWESSEMNSYDNYDATKLNWQCKERIR
ncbi:MAG: hypothetical protein OXT74_13185 [Candidatus Poribacteria bacterium]|nr:hypothetical protein [Candidatus Poribacteria bacterium]